jgi:hypothetical protein
MNIEKLIEHRQRADLCESATLPRDLLIDILDTAINAERDLSDARTVRVPREPTMGQWDDFCAVHHVPFDKFIVAYKAMLSAAPSGGRNE